MNKLEFKSALSVSDEGEISGIAWVFDTPDRTGDIITKGAFSTAPSRLPILWSHDQREVLGVWNSVRETAQGLEVKGRLLVNDVQRAAEIHALVKSGAVQGLSIGFSVQKATSRPRGGRTIYKTDLQEISIVSVPAHPNAQILTVKENILEHEDNNAPDYAALETKFNELETKFNSVNILTNRLDKIETRLNRPGTGNVETKDNAGESETKAFDNFMRLGVERMPQIETKALISSTNSAGGFTVPPAYLAEITKQLVLYSSVRSLARVTSVGTTPVLLPKRTGTTTVSWVDEGSPSPSTQQTYDRQSFDIFEMGAHCDVSNRLLEDSMFNLESEIAMDLGQQFGLSESAAFIGGNGIGKPAGIIGNASIPFTPGLNSLTFITPGLLIEMFYSLPTFYAKNAVWTMSRGMMGYIRGLVNGLEQFLWQDSTGGLAGGQPAMLLGRPIIEMPELPHHQNGDGSPLAIGTIPIIFGDWQAGFRIFDRVGVSIMRDPFSQATDGLVRFHARRRVGGAVSLPEAFRFLKIAA